MSAIADAIAVAAPTFTGELLRPHDYGYQEHRRIHNGLIDKHPAIIASCRGIADIVDAVRMAHSLGLQVSVRGGGHNVAGRAIVERGLMIDLSPMKGIDVDVAAQTVRAQGGVVWKELNRETQLHGLATTGGVVGTTGIGGLTLGGGIGWLMPKFGLALDNLRSADVVLADGQVVRVSAVEHPDLYWAIRGGGGNFGIAASLEYELHQVGPLITGGAVVHSFARAFDVLRFYRDFCATLPDEAMAVAALQTAPDGSNQKVVAVLGSHCGPIAQGEATFRSLKAFGPPIVDMLAPLPYVTLNSMIDPAFPKGALNYWKAQFLTDLSDAAIRALIEGFEDCPSPLSHIIIEHFHGAVSRVPVGATACPMRLTGFNVAIASQWLKPSETEDGVGWARDTFDSLTPFLASTRYVNYLEADAQDAAVAAYGPNLPRLRAIKTQYDPENFFRHNVNILPQEKPSATPRKGSHS